MFPAKPAVPSAVLRCLAIALVATLLAACSTATRVAYSNAPFAGTWVVDDWFDLHDGQRDWVKERLARFIAWHRASELPDYEKLLQDTAARAATRLAEDDLRRIYREMRALYHRLLRKAIPDIADFLLQLHPEQVTHLERKYAEDNARVIKESIKGTPQERLEVRTKRFLEQIEGWTGRLTAPQRDLVRARIVAMPDLADDWLGDRRFRQAETLALLRAKPAREAMIAGLTRILLETDSWRRPEYAAKLRGRDEQVVAMIAALDATLTAEQRARLHRRLSNYAADVAYLMVAN
jgi:hypothetical protein